MLVMAVTEFSGENCFRAHIRFVTFIRRRKGERVIEKEVCRY